MIELEPDNIQERFSLAYDHSHNSNNDLALYHYTRIPREQRDGTTWNNIGAALSEFAMPGKAVNAYKKAEAADDTLGMANLG
jgi:hypothetical protein